MTQSPKTKHRRPPSPAERGRIGGQAKTPAKAKAARRNGKRGGRPQKPLPTVLLAQMILGLQAADRAFANAAVGLANYVMA
jgi:hypothetical protein